MEILNMLNNPDTCSAVIANQGLDLGDKYANNSTSSGQQNLLQPKPLVLNFGPGNSSNLITEKRIYGSWTIKTFRLRILRMHKNTAITELVYELTKNNKQNSYGATTSTNERQPIFLSLVLGPDASGIGNYTIRACASGTKSASYAVSLETLSKHSPPYVSYLKIEEQGHLPSTATCTDAYKSESAIKFNTVCSRWCSSACQQPGMESACSGNFKPEDIKPLQTYVNGFFSECGPGTDGKAYTTCNCNS